MVPDPIRTSIRVLLKLARRHLPERRFAVTLASHTDAIAAVNQPRLLKRCHIGNWPDFGNHRERLIASFLRMNALLSLATPGPVNAK
jgi:hypothetical protein